MYCRLLATFWTASLLRSSGLILLLGLIAVGFTPILRAVSPPPDGGYGNLNTAEGTDALRDLTTGIGNTALGEETLEQTTRGGHNTATGVRALRHNTLGNTNTATGGQALYRNTVGSDNTASGYDSLHFNTTGSFNTAAGRNALFSNTTASYNTALGAEALYGNTTGDSNTATGNKALFSNTTGDKNTATGFYALANNTSGGFNTATGFNALASNKGSFNTANGTEALSSNTTAFFNTAIGVQALHSNTTGLSNTANGYQALYLNQTGGANSASGVQALYRTTGGSNIALGFQAGVNLTTGDNNIDIGNVGIAGESDTIRLGTKGTHKSTFIAGISGVAVTGTQVVVNQNGKLGVVASSARFKEAIRPMDKSSEAILALKPVTFRYKEELDSDKIPQFGLIAEEVGKVNPDLVVRDEGGKVNTVRYEAVNAMLLNEFLKEHKKVAELENTIAELKATVAKQQDAFGSKVAQQQKQIEALSAGLQKVSAAVERNKPTATQFADNR